MNEPDLLPGLRRELVDAARRQQRRRRVRTRLGVGLAAAAAVVASVVVGDVLRGSSPAGAGVEITVVDDRFQVLLTDVETRPQVVEAALRGAGIDVTVRSVPVGPSNLGRFVALPSELPPDLRPIDVRNDTFPGFLVPVDFDGPIELQLGGPARPGEQYAAPSDAYAPGEPLSCLGIYGAPLADIPDLVGTGLRVRVLPFAEEAAGPPIDLASAIDEHPDLRATEALATSADEVLILANATGESPFTASGGGEDRPCGEGE